MSLTLDTVLRRAPNLVLHLVNNNEFRISVDGITFTCGQHSLAILDIFSTPVSLSVAVGKLQSRTSGAQDWMELTQTIAVLHSYGVLLDDKEEKLPLKTDPTGFDAAFIHIKMLNDRERTTSYLKAISEIVRPGDVVVDIGTGTGVLAIAAARAGAKHVYAIEGGHIGKAAELVFRENGLDNRITLVEGWSTQVELPERADVLVSEIIGDDPFGEQVIEVFADAFKRLLKPDAKIIPQRMCVYALPLSVPEDVIMKHRFTEHMVQKWQRWYDISFRPLSEQCANNLYRFKGNSTTVAGWKKIGDPVLIADVDLSTTPDLRVESKQRGVSATRGILNGFAVYFDANLSPNTILSTNPIVANDSNSWHPLVWLLPESIALNEGEEFELIYRRRTHGAKIECRRFSEPAISIDYNQSGLEQGAKRRGIL